MCTCANFFFPYFSCPFCRFSIFVFFFFAFSFVFSTFSRKWRRTMFVQCTMLELRHLFIRYSVHFVKEIVKLLKKSEPWENKWSKVRPLQDKPRSRWLGFLTNCVKNVSINVKNVSICVIIQQDCKVKRKLQVHNIKVSSTTVWRYAICKLYTKGRPAGKLTWCEPSSNHLDYRWWTLMRQHSKIQPPKHWTS